MSPWRLLSSTTPVALSVTRLSGLSDVSRSYCGALRSVRTSQSDVCRWFRPTNKLPSCSEGKGNALKRRRGRTLATLFNQQVARTPEASALICGERCLTYRELNDQAERLAAKLVALGVGPDALVAVSLPRTSDLIVAILAIHKAGGAYLPLDPSYPHERLTYMVENSNAQLIVTQRAQATLFTATGARLVLLDELTSEKADHPAKFEVQDRIQPDNLAYVIYTSGSTGKPKGVAVTHESVVNMVLSARTIVSDEDISGVLFATSLNFDISVYEIFLPLSCGGAIILVNNLFDLATASAKDKISLINTVPSLISGIPGAGQPSERRSRCQPHRGGAAARPGRADL